MPNQFKTEPKRSIDAHRAEITRIDRTNRKWREKKKTNKSPQCVWNSSLLLYCMYFIRWGKTKVVVAPNTIHTMCVMSVGVHNALTAHPIIRSLWWWFRNELVRLFTLKLLLIILIDVKKKLIQNPKIVWMWRWYVDEWMIIQFRFSLILLLSVPNSQMSHFDEHTNNHHQNKWNSLIYWMENFGTIIWMWFTSMSMVNGLNIFYWFTKLGVFFSKAKKPFVCVAIHFIWNLGNLRWSK